MKLRVLNIFQGLEDLFTGRHLAPPPIIDSLLLSVHYCDGMHTLLISSLQRRVAVIMGENFIVRVARSAHSVGTVLRHADTVTAPAHVKDDDITVHGDVKPTGPQTDGFPHLPSADDVPSDGYVRRPARRGPAEHFQERAV